MNDFADRIILALYSVFGAGLGFLVYAFGLGGLLPLLTGKDRKPWNGLISLILWVLIGAGWGWVAYKFKHREFGPDGSSLAGDSGSAWLFSKRVMVVASCFVVLYFLWSFATGR